MNSPPVAVGGVGGSGTRLIASLLQKAGYYIGDDLNQPLDNLWFTYLLKRRELWPIEHHGDALRQALDLFLNLMTAQGTLSDSDRNLIDCLAEEPRLHHPLVWRESRRASIYQQLQTQQSPNTHWGWKEPNTHFFLPFLDQNIEGLKYIHVMRHGLDMAASHNQNQLVYWGPELLGQRIERRNPTQSLSFWRKTHERVISAGETMKERFYLLNFDDFCHKPNEHLPTLLKFLGVSAASMDHYLAEITIPASTGRRRRYQLDEFNHQDLEYVRSLGFEV